MTTYSLDTDIITKLLKKHPGNQRVVDRFRQEIKRNSLFVICPVVYYEMRRELVFKGARRQLAAFETLANLMAWKEFNAPIWDRACHLWSTFRAKGRSHHDADTLIDVGPESPVRQPELVSPAVRLLPNGMNLSSVLYTIQQDHEDDWQEILEDLHTAYPDFLKLTVPAGGGDGKVHLRWFERPFEKQGISANLLSDGMLKLLCLIAILKTPNPPPLICIDEPELGLHPDWVRLVAELLQSASDRTQVIVATHSPQLVAKLEPEEVMVTEKVDGETHLSRLKTADLENWLKDFSLGELWLSGEIGGRP